MLHSDQLISGKKTFSETVYVSSIDSSGDYKLNNSTVLSSKGTGNILLGSSSGENISTGSSNTFLGVSAGRTNTVGSKNTYVGKFAGYNNESGNYNTFIGSSTGHWCSSGNNNTIVGCAAGQNNRDGNGNVFIGYQAGLSEMGSNKLYIDNSSTEKPLIYGNFDSNTVTINGNLIVTGECSGCKTVKSNTKYDQLIDQLIKEINQLKTDNIELKNRIIALESNTKSIH